MNPAVIAIERRTPTSLLGKKLAPDHTCIAPQSDKGPLCHDEKIMTKGLENAFTIEFCILQTDRPVSRSHSHISLALECIAPVSYGRTSAPTIMGATIQKRLVPCLTRHESTPILHHVESDASRQ